MNIAELFILQSELDRHVEQEHPRKKGESRHDKKVLALLVELGELANEARFFKFWSNDQKPRKEEIKGCMNCMGLSYGDKTGFCYVCNNEGAIYTNPLLEEYVDGIHFLLSIGLENGIEELNINPIKKDTLIEQFIGLYNVFSLLYVYFTPKAYSDAWSAYVGLADMLGLYWEDVEAAYIEKNEKNHARQDGGY